MIGEWSIWGDVDILVGFPMVYLAMTCMSRLRLVKQGEWRKVTKAGNLQDAAWLG